MDKTDLRILEILQDNARTSNSEIARQIGMVPSGVLERIRKLEENGVIKGYTASLDPELLELGLTSFVSIKTNELPGDCCAAEKIAKYTEVMEIYHVAGDDCYLLKVRVKDNKALAEFLREKLGSLNVITSTKTVIALETIKETSKMKL